jgi:riboflavin synthase
VFTGLIEMQGTVLNSGSRLEVDAAIELPQVGESIALNGVCLTLLPEAHAPGVLAFDVSPETLAITTLGQLQPGDKVNLERAVLAGGTRLGGHYVSGHVDTTAVVKSIQHLDDFINLSVGDFAISAEAYLLPKGSITLDGVSLTINEVSSHGINVMLVPHTLAMTTFGQVQTGQRINVEFDYLTRIVAHQLALSTSCA